MSQRDGLGALASSLAIVNAVPVWAHRARIQAVSLTAAEQCEGVEFCTLLLLLTREQSHVPSLAMGKSMSGLDSPWMIKPDGVIDHNYADLLNLSELQVQWSTLYLISFRQDSPTDLVRFF